LQVFSGFFLYSVKFDIKFLVYYRLFTENIGIPLTQPAFASDPYMGRVRANSITPPQTVHLIKRRLCKVENISDYLDSILYLSRSSRSPVDDGERVSVFTPEGSGSTPADPIELVVKLSYGCPREYSVVMSLKPKYSTRSTFIP